MKLALFLAVAVFSALIALKEVWTYLRRDAAADPFVDAKRLWRRCAGVAALSVSAGLFLASDYLAARMPGLSARVGLASAILLSAFIALLLALRDASATAKTALKRDRDLRMQSVQAVRDCIERGAKPSTPDVAPNQTNSEEADRC